MTARTFLHVICQTRKTESNHHVLGKLNLSLVDARIAARRSILVENLDTDSTIILKVADNQFGIINLQLR